MSKLSFSAELILSRFKNQGPVSAGTMIPESTFVSFIGRPEIVDHAAKELAAEGFVTVTPDSSIALTEAGARRLAS